MLPIERYIDHTLLKPTASPSDIVTLCEEAKRYHFYAVCVNGAFVALANVALQDTEVKVAAVVGFPLGAMSTEAKVAEAQYAVMQGATEIDMVMAIGHLKAGQLDYVTKDIMDVKKAIKKVTLKVILEMCYLSDREKEQACLCAIKGGADFLKTSTGFGTGGATVGDISLMKSIAGQTVQIKASGGIRDYDTAHQYVKLGVHRIGTSNGIAIVEGKSVTGGEGASY